MSQVGTVVILAAGQGTRMKSALPKVLHELCGQPMLGWVIDQALSLDPARIVVVVGHGADQVQAAVESGPASGRLTFVVQEPQNGTGHALQCAAPHIDAAAGAVVVLYGDMPALAKESLADLVQACEAAGDAGMAMLSSWPEDPTGFGRVVRGDGGEFCSIVEQRDASPEELAIGEVNLGVYAFPAAPLLDYLPRLSNENAQGEYYLTDVPAMFVADGRAVSVVELEDPDEGLGVNTLMQLAEARWALQVRILEEHLAGGVRIEDPATTYIDAGVTIGRGTRILPCTVIRTGVEIGEDCEVGPFTHLRAGTTLADGAEVGNFTECKNSTLGRRTKAKHLAYLGDADLGDGCNVGAGTIFANYDGVKKHRTTVGDGAFLGSGTTVVAPNAIGAGATTGANSVVRRETGIGEHEVWAGVPARQLAGKESVAQRKAAARKGGESR